MYCLHILYLHHLVHLVCLQKFGVGEKVLVDSDERKVIQQQEDHGGWNSKMKKVYLIVFMGAYVRICFIRKAEILNDIV